ALEAFDPGKALQGTGVLRADAIDPDFVELADFTRIRYRKREHVPERKTEMIDHDFTACLRIPFRLIKPRQQFVNVARCGVEVDLCRNTADQFIDPCEVALGE